MSAHPILDELQRESYSYFLHETNPRNGLIRDKTRRGWPASIAAVGMALAAVPEPSIASTPRTRSPGAPGSGS